MVLSQTAQYALRAMAWLTTVPSGVPIRVKDLSSATGIPSHYLSKVMRRLVLAGLVTSQKGQGGGFLLSKPPDEIPFTAILSPLHDSWSRLNEQLEAWAKGTTLADLTRDGFENREVRVQVDDDKSAGSKPRIG